MMRILQFSMPQNFNLFLFGDQHIGARASHRPGWHKLIDQIESEYDGVTANYAVDHGDCIEAISSDDPRFNAATTKEGYILEQIHQAARDRLPIKHKLLAVLMGNHEAKHHRFGDIGLEMCRQIWGDDAKLHYGTYSARLTYRYNDLVLFRHYATHGRKSIGSVADDIERQVANSRIQLKRHLYRKAGDCLLMSKGHTHRLLIREPSQELYITDDGDGLQQRYTTQNMYSGAWIDPDSRWYCNTGSFLKTFLDGVSTYSEMAEYDPTEMGFLVVRYRNMRIKGIDKITI